MLRELLCTYACARARRRAPNPANAQPRRPQARETLRGRSPTRRRHVGSARRACAGYFIGICSPVCTLTANSSSPVGDVMRFCPRGSHGAEMALLFQGRAALTVESRLPLKSCAFHKTVLPPRFISPSAMLSPPETKLLVFLNFVPLKILWELSKKEERTIQVFAFGKRMLESERQD